MKTEPISSSLQISLSSQKWPHGNAPSSKDNTKYAGSKKKFNPWRRKIGARIHLPILFPFFLLSAAIFCSAHGQTMPRKESFLSAERGSMALLPPYSKTIYLQDYNHYEYSWNSSKPVIEVHPHEKFNGKVYCSRRCVKMGSSKDPGEISLEFMPLSRISSIRIKIRGARYAKEKDSLVEVSLLAGEKWFFDTLELRTFYKDTESEPYRANDSMTQEGADFSSSDSCIFLINNSASQGSAENIPRRIHLKTFANAQCYLDQYQIDFLSHYPIEEEAIDIPEEEPDEESGNGQDDESEEETDTEPGDDTDSNGHGSICPPASDLQVIESGIDHAILKWKGTSGNYILKTWTLFGEQQHHPHITETSYLAEKLLANTYYLWGVSPVCGKDTAQWVIGPGFLTLPDTLPEENDNHHEQENPLLSSPQTNVSHAYIYPNPNHGEFHLWSPTNGNLFLLSPGYRLKHIQVKKGYNTLHISQKGYSILYLKTISGNSIFKIVVL